MRDGAPEKDAQIAELAAMKRHGRTVTGKAADAIREVKQQTLCSFVISHYRETKRQCAIRNHMTPDSGAVPPYEIQDAWKAIESLMSAEFGEHWRDANSAIRNGSRNA